MLEPAVTLTDFALFLLCTAFSVLLMRTDTDRERTRRYFSLLFGTIAGGALAGALTHGFFGGEVAGGILWRVTMLLIGLAGACCFVLALDLLIGAATGAIALAAMAFLGYAAYVLFVRSSFVVALCFYVPAALLLLIGFLRRFGDAPNVAALGSLGMLLTFLAAWIQNARIALSRSYFDHNATYHLVQAIGLLLVFAAARKWLRMAAA